LTNRVIERLKHTGPRSPMRVYDEAQRGLVLCVWKSGRLSWAVRFKDLDGKDAEEHLGDYQAWERKLKKIVGLATPTRKSKKSAKAQAGTKPPQAAKLSS